MENHVGKLAITGLAVGTFGRGYTWNPKAPFSRPTEKGASPRTDPWRFA
jgi:hypothetical protein